MVLSKEAQAGRDLLLDKNNNYELFLRNEGKGNNGEAPELLLAEDDGEVFQYACRFEHGQHLQTGKLNHVTARERMPIAQA